MKRALVIWISLLLLGVSAYAQPSTDFKATNARLKALYIYNFAKKVDWPAEYKTGNFVIGVVGSDDVYDKLVQLYSSKSIASQPIEIKRFESATAIDRCHLLYVPEKQHGAIAEIVKNVGKNSSLIVTEKDGGIEDGAVINFIIKDSKLKYELNNKTAASRKLLIGTDLQHLAFRFIE